MHSEFMLFEQILKRISGGLALQTSQFHQIIQITALSRIITFLSVGWKLHQQWKKYFSLSHVAVEKDIVQKIVHLQSMT